MATNLENKGECAKSEGSTTWERIAAFVCSIYMLCLGTTIGWTSPAIMILLSPNSPIQMTTSDVSNMVSVMCIGQTIGSLLSMFIVDRIGRKNTILLTTICTVISWSLIIVNINTELYNARFVVGISVGACLSVTPMYIGEISSPATRGVMGSLLPIMANLGILLAYAIVPFCTIKTSAGIFLAISIGFILLFLFMPKSPYYLTMRGRTEEAEKILEKLRGKSDANEELQQFLDSLSRKRLRSERNNSLKNIFFVRANRRGFLVVFLLVVSQFFGGLVAIVIYGQLIFKDVGSAITDYVANVSVGLLQLIFAIIMGSAIDKVGRRPLLFFSGITIGICDLTIGTYFYFKDYTHANTSNYALVPFFAALIMIASFNYGLVSLQTVIMSEIFAIDIKAIGICLNITFSGIFAGIVTKLYLMITKTWGYGHAIPFFGFAVIVWLCTFFILRILPETKGKTFDEIQRKLDK